MAYNRIHHAIYEKHNWCKNCNLVTVDKSILRCPSCGFKVRTKPRSFGKVVVRKEDNISKKVVTTVLKLLDDKRGLTARRIMEITYQKTGVNLLA